jgi:hypothetical protein
MTATNHIGEKPGHCSTDHHCIPSKSTDEYQVI